MYRHLSRALLAGAVLFAVLIPNTAEAAPAPVPGCVGVRLTPSQDVVTIVGTRPQGTTFCFDPGVYRVTKPITPRRGQVLVGQPGTVINGAKVISTWVQSGTVWIARGQTQGPTINKGGGYGGAYLNPESVYSDDVYMDKGALLKVGVQVGGKTVGDPVSTVGPGEYFVDYDRDEVVVGSNPVGRQVEVAIADSGVQSSEPQVTVSGLRVEMTTRGGIMTGQANWTIQNNEVRFAHYSGVNVGAGAQVLNNYLHDNGAYGITGSGANILVRDNEISHNNVALYYHSSGECYDAGGSKFTLTNNIVIKNNFVHDNLCPGLWLDINNTNSLVEGNRSNRNVGYGIYHEISYNAIIRNNVTKDNTRFGILVASSPGDQIYGNTVSGNGSGGIRLNQTHRADWPSPLGPHVVKNTDIHHNTITQLTGVSGPHEVAGLVGTVFDDAVYSSTNRWHDNKWYIGSPTVKAFEWLNVPVTWAQWQALGHDLGMTLG